MNDFVAVEISPALRRLGDDIIVEFEEANTTLAALIEERWHRNVFKIKGGPRNKIAYDTGAYEAGIRLVPGLRLRGMPIREILSDVGYGDIIEKGIPGTSYTARPIAKITLEESDATIERELDRAGRRVERKIG